MTRGGLDVQSIGGPLGSCSAPKVEEPPSTDNVVDGVGRLGINGEGKTSSVDPSYEVNDPNKEDGGGGVQVTCFTEVLDDVTLHLQIIRLHIQHNAVSVTNILGGASDNTESGIARRIVLKTGLNVILACNIPKNSPMLEADAEKMLVQKLINLGYTWPKYNGSSS